MKKALLLTGLLLVLVAPLATAAGVNLNWGSLCWGDVAASNLKTFACATNATSNTFKMTASFVVADLMPDYANVATYIKGVSETGIIPDWWRLATGDCRNATGVYVAAQPAYPGNVELCADMFGGTGQGGGGWGYLDAGTLVEQSVYAVAAPGVELPADLETFACTFTIKNLKTVGTGSCAGCLTGMVFGLHHVTVGGAVSSPVMLTTPVVGGNQCLVWQHDFPGQPCNAPVPARNTTWGQVKSLYR